MVGNQLRSLIRQWIALARINPKTLFLRHAACTLASNVEDLYVSALSTHLRFDEVVDKPSS